MADKPMCINQASLNIFRLEPGIAFKNHIGCITCRQHPKNMFDS